MALKQKEIEELGKHEREHYQKYNELAKKIGIEKLKPLIRVGAWKIKEALEEGDERLNLIPIHLWDRWASVGANLKPLMIAPWTYLKDYPGEQSAAMRVCILKHVAKYYLC